ncbi:MAG: hypothetical protein K0S56_964 [Microvirga sp.]|jgi:uncharacterized membrane protein YqaE (UPF0057 family)|nr:hypothetical protein [Microvirga sp.]
MIARVIYFILCLIAPPLGVYMLRGVGIGFFLSLLLTVGSAVVFFGFYAGPGLALFGLAVLHAVVTAVLPRRPIAAASYQ